MKLFVILLLGALAVLLAVAAIVFRSERAIGFWKRVRLAAWAYVAIILLAAAYRLWSNGGF